MSSVQRRPLRIANVSGFYGDRLSAVREQLAGDVDVLTGDYLAELTMLILGKDRLRDPALGYAKTFARQVSEVLPELAERRIRMVSNAGGLNPAGLAAVLRSAIAEAGLALVVAHVEGDDLRERADALGLAGAVTANAYLGAFGIAAALDAGADIVVTGRVTDASLVIGPAIHHHGWGRTDYDALAGAMVAGHVIECGTHATGGNYSGFARADAGLGDLTRPAFPIALVAADGSSTITTHAGVHAEVHGLGGAATPDTVTAQLLYEIGSTRYLGPDVVAHLDSIELAPVDEADGFAAGVRISGVRGSAPPPTLKVGANLIGGYRNTVEFLLTGLDIEAKADLVQRQMGAHWGARPPHEVTWRLDQTAVADPATQPRATSYLRCDVRDRDEAVVGRTFTGAAVELALGSYPGFTTTRPPGPATPFGVFRAAFVGQGEVPHRVVLTDAVIDIPAPDVTGSEVAADRCLDIQSRAALEGPPRETAEASITRSVPLGRLVDARSGDKGGDANIGVWIPWSHPRRDEAAAWLAATLTPGRVRDLLPEAAGLDVEVHRLPNLRGVNIVIHGLLGLGVAASTRVDPQAKAVGEWLRAREIDIPEELLP